MKIAFDAKRAIMNATGLGSYSRILLNALIRDFSENEYLLFTPKITAGYIEEIQGIYQLKLPETNFSQLFHPYWRSFLLADEVLKSKAEIFHGLSNELPVFRNKETQSGIKKIVTIHDLIFLKHKVQYSFFDRKTYTLKTQYAIQNADQIIVPSIETKKDLLHYFKTDERKIEVVYQSCSPNFYETKSFEERESVKIKYALPNKFILNVSSFHPRKNQLQLIKAFEKIKDNMEEKLLLVGNSGKMLPIIKKYIADRNLANDVLILTAVFNEDLPAIYQLSSAFVYPSILEGFGIPILEALFSKVPVITSKGGCFEEVGGEKSLYVNPASVDDLAEKILFSLSNSTERNIIIATGMAHAQTMTDKAFAKNMMTAYLK